MPLLVHVAERQQHQQKPHGRLVKPAPKSASELAAQALSNLWRRLYQSYQRFSQPGCDPFVTDAASAALATENTAGIEAIRWAPGFSALSTCDALIQHLYLCNEHFDTLSWVIAFSLIDRLQLHHYVRQRLQNISFWRPLDSSPTSFQIVKEDVSQLLFTVYTLAFKWHLDYTVSIKYLTNLLPHTTAARRTILRTTVKYELLVLKVLDYNCAVSGRHMAQLLEHFLTATERSCILRAVHRS